MKFFLFLLLFPSLFLSAIEVKISSPKITLDQDFKLTITHPQDLDLELLRKSVMAKNSKGIYPLFLAKETVEKNTITYILKPQYPGVFTLQLPFSTPPITLEVAPASSYTTSFPPAPLMPLVKGDPLELRLDLRKILYQKSHAQDNVDIIRSHSYPWGRSAGALLLMLLAPFALAYWRQNQPPLRKEKVKDKDPLAELYQLKGVQADPRALSFMVGELFKEGFEPILHKETSSMTFQELLSHLQEEGEIKRLCLELENMQFSSEDPEKDEVDKALEKATYLLERLIS